ncbi:arginine--tRNA ligase [Fulvivirga sp. M361]|uniref:arginine--tRNA ligase n=1 Tax=Fulvivirga sp. M361 TaxID=2594266 RepID=UPI00117AC98A|nr:arginine--tRNA ligase [Fulvivirga sp. M361]TRX47140.1 arginine--tRNA ligase [Fulvivirga sp. M361]
MDIKQTLTKDISSAFSALFSTGLEAKDMAIQPTRREFNGSHTLVCFPLARLSKKGPEQTAEALGSYLKENSSLVKAYNVVKGFLNLELTNETWLKVFRSIISTDDYGQLPTSGKEMMVEYSSPNTNKPLHLGHLRNNFLGWSVAEILQATGHKVHKVQIINDRGIHICKSMVAWLRYGEGETPASSGKKGDKLVGDYYVMFDQHYREEIAELEAGGMKKEVAEKEAPILKEAQALLLKWEQKDPEIYKLWEQMNQWVYAGFEATYEQMGVDFDKLYYESDTYLLGKDEVLKGVEEGVFYKKEDGSVWVDLTDEGLDQKLLLRADGTSVYMTQDIGTAILRFRDFPGISRQIYTVGNEQEYHFKVLFIILEKLGYSWAKECYHLSYGMVDLPSGKMKSREGIVVDADDLMQEMMDTAEEHTKELGKIEGLSDDQATHLYYNLGLGALKYFLLKVDPKKRMLFDPNESIQFQGHTGPFIQYTHARISAILRKSSQLGIEPSLDSTEGLELHPTERDIINTMNDFESKIKEAAESYSPDVIGQYVYDLAKEYNRFYQEVSIFNEENELALRFRVALSAVTARIIKKAMGLLGINVPDRM